MLIINARIITMSADDEAGGAIDNGFIEISGERISDIGEMAAAPIRPNDEIIDLGGRTVIPGFIDAHTHLGLCRAGEPYCESYINSGANTSPQRSPLECALADSYFDEALRAGVTAAAITFGSESPMPGKVSVVKTYGGDMSSMVIKEYAAQKLALGENPNKALGDIGAAGVIRAELKAAREFVLKGHGEYAPEKAAALKPLLEGKLPAHIHVHALEDINAALEIAEEFKIKIVLLHATDGYMLADTIKLRGIPVIYGPIVNDKSKAELMRMDEACPAVLSRAGVLTALCTDHPETPAKYLQLCAAVAVRNGMAALDALRAVTINAARILGIEERTGSLEKGKDADMAVFADDPLDVRCAPEMVICNGERIRV